MPEPEYHDVERCHKGSQHVQWLKMTDALLGTAEMHTYTLPLPDACTCVNSDGSSRLADGIVVLLLIPIEVAVISNSINQNNSTNRFKLLSLYFPGCHSPSVSVNVCTEKANWFSGALPGVGRKLWRHP